MCMYHIDLISKEKCIMYATCNYIHDIVLPCWANQQNIFMDMHGTVPLLYTVCNLFAYANECFALNWYQSTLYNT